jgi:hypothetical protein
MARFEIELREINPRLHDQLGENRQDACERLITAYKKNWRIESVDGVPCIGRCESCEKFLFEGDKFHSDEELVLLCNKCTVPQ